MEVFRKIKYFMNVLMCLEELEFGERSSVLDRDGKRMTPAILELSQNGLG